MGEHKISAKSRHVLTKLLRDKSQVEHTAAESKGESFLVLPRTQLHQLQDILGAVFLVPS